MERLTKRVGVDEAVPICDFDICAPFQRAGKCETGTQGFPFGRLERHCNDTCILGRMIDRLAAYEDTGLTPEQIGKPLAEFLHPVDNYGGLKGKYLVFKADTGEQVVNCFVLRPDKDTAAVDALRAYAKATENETLTEDIYNWVGKDINVPSKWIPVSNRLPEDDLPRDSKKKTLKVMVAIKADNGVYTIRSQTRSKHPYYHPNTWEWGKFTCGTITHWMPLPDSPKEVSE